MIRKFIKKTMFSLIGLTGLAMILSCSPDAGAESGVSDPFAGSHEGITFSAAQKFAEGSASNVTYNANGSVTYIASAQYSGGAYLFYIKPDKSVINLENYESIEVEFSFEPVAGKWASGAKNPQWCLNLYGSDATFWNGGKTLSYFSDNKKSGFTKYKYNVSASDEGDFVAVGVKLNAYQTGNADSDQCKITIGKIKFNRKAGAPEDKPADDGLTDEQRGSVVKITYSSKDYENGGTTATTKPAYVYLPAGYDATDTSKKYPVLYLMHGVGGNEAEWAMTGDNSKVKKIMDKRIADGSVKPFIIVTPNGRSNSNFSNCDFSNMNAFYSFGSELRNDLIPYMETNYNVITGDRNARAMAGLSMGGMQTINIGLCESLDLISWFGAFSAAPTSYEASKINSIITGADFNAFDINYFYNICGTDDDTAYASASAAAKNLKTVCPSKFNSDNFTWYECGGGHDFNIWYKGFEAFAQIVFNK